MLTVISLMLGGMLAGFLLRKRRRIPMQRLITSLVWLLLFLLGVEAGSNSDVVRGLHTLGAEALLMAVCTTGGSVAAARLLWDITRRKRRKDGSQHLPEADAPAQGEHALRGSLVIIAFFMAGTVCGLLHLLPFDVAESRVSFYALCVLMACVGISVGNNPTLAASCRGLSPWYALLPVATIVGTMAGSLLAFLLLPGRSAADCLAVGSGFGYYSLSSIFITEYKGAALGTVALLANILREIITLLAAPLLARWCGRLAPIAAGGATTMDTTLPVIAQTSGQAFVVVSIFHGFVVDFSVPFLVTLFCSF